jgi:hypothetical protein
METLTTGEVKRYLAAVRAVRRSRRRAVSSPVGAMPMPAGGRFELEVTLTRDDLFGYLADVYFDQPSVSANLHLAFLVLLGMVLLAGRFPVSRLADASAPVRQFWFSTMLCGLLAGVASLLAYRRRARRRVLLLFAPLAYVGTLCSAKLIEMAPLFYGVLTGFVLLCWLLAALAMHGICRWRLRRRLKEWLQANREIAGEYSVTISPEGVSSYGGPDAETIPWSACSRVHGTSGYLCFYLESGGFSILPRRAFASPQAAEACLEASRAWHAAAKQTSASG